MHLTLKFIGEVNDKDLEVIITRLNEIKLNKIDVNLSNMGIFPNNDFINYLNNCLNDYLNNYYINFLVFIYETEL